jgi:effector-binding domain-containing protein
MVVRSMNKRSVIILAAVLSLLIIGILLSTQFGIKREKEVIVSTPIIEVSPVVTDLKNWPDWFAGVGEYKFQMINSNPAGATVKSERGSIQSIYVISAYPDSIPSRTHLKWTTLISGFDWLKEKLFFIDDSPGSRLGELKNYFENPREFYGFDINLGKVEDTLVLTREVRVKKTELTATLGQVYRELQDYARKEHVNTNIDSCRMATFYDQTADSVRFAAGIPITTRISLAQDGIKLLEMPPKGRAVIGRYQGPYKDLPRLYEAMRKYIADKKLLMVTAPYEKYLSKSGSPQDSLNMRIELHMPVF